MAGFPNSPSLNDTYTLGDKTWEWDGTMWRIKTTGAVGPQGSQGNQGVAGSNGTNGTNGVQGPQGNQGPGLSISTPTSQTGDFLFGNSTVAYRNSNLISDADEVPFFTRYGEKIFDYGTANSSAGETFDIDLNNGLLHFVDLSTGSTSNTYTFSLTGYSSNTSTSFALILRGGQNLTLNWGDINWESTEGTPDFSSATAGIYSVLPIYGTVISSNLEWLGGAKFEYQL